MQTVSAEFLAAMGKKPFVARIILDGVDVIEGDAIEHIRFIGGCGENDEAVSLGATVAASCEVTLQRDLVTVDISGREIAVQLGLKLESGIEWLDMGVYTVTDVTADDGSLTVTALDALAAKMEEEYEAIDGFDFYADEGVSSNEYLQAVCDRLGVTVDMTGLDDIRLDAQPTGLTWRQIVGAIAALSGKFAYIDRLGVLRFGWYTGSGYVVDPDSYYPDGMEKTAHDFSVGWIKCYVESLEETLCEGDETALQGIYFVCPWMTQERLWLLWEQVGGFSYQPVKALRFVGDPRLDPGDMVTLIDLHGDSASVPVMAICHEFDGGLITEISAKGQLKTESYEGPVQREVKRTAAKILKKAGEIEMSIQDLDGKTTLAMINLSENMAKIQANEIYIEAIANAGKEAAENAAEEVQNIQQNGASKVVTKTGYTFDADGLRIQKPGQEIENLLDHTGMYVTRNGDAMLQANANGVVAADVTVRNYLVVGEHARFEDYNNGKDSKRTACFWREGE